jgi:hypothetical protein
MNLLTSVHKRLAITTLNARRGVQTVGPEELLTDSHISSYQEYLQWQYAEPGLRSLTGAETLILALEEPTSLDHVLAKTAAQEKLLSGTTLVIPVHAQNHWTMLAVEQHDGAVTAARYYDSLPQENQECRRRAQAVLQALTNDGNMELPKRRNSWHQNNGHDCGIAVCHYIEEELRSVRGEGLGRSWPEPKKVRERLQMYLQQLSREWNKWQLEQAKAGIEVNILDKDEVEEDGKKLEAASAAWHETNKGPGKRLVLEYRCSRCRWSPSGKGCISCNPFKKDEKMKELVLEQQTLQGAAERAAAGEATLLLPPLPPPEAEEDVVVPQLVGGGGSQ